MTSEPNKIQLPSIQELAKNYKFFVTYVHLLFQPRAPFPLRKNPPVASGNHLRKLLKFAGNIYKKHQKEGHEVAQREAMGVFGLAGEDNAMVGNYAAGRRELEIFFAPHSYSFPGNLAIAPTADQKKDFFRRLKDRKRHAPNHWPDPKHFM